MVSVPTDVGGPSNHASDLILLLDNHRKVDPIQAPSLITLLMSSRDEITC